jgi:hypothetical protein
VPELHDIYLGVLFGVCPYAAPVFPIRDKRQTDIEYKMQSLGYHQSSLGKKQNFNAKSDV